MSVNMSETSSVCEENFLLYDIQKYRRLFDKYDRNPRDGYLNIKELKRIISKHIDYDDDIPKHVVDKVFKMSDENGDGKISFEEFVDMVQNPKLKSVFGKVVTKYVNFVVPPKNQRIGRQQRTFGSVTSLNDVDSIDGTGAYEEEYTCCPPALGMIIITAFEITCFLTDYFLQPGSTDYGSGPVADALIYKPFRRKECYRFLTYMFVHIGHLHLIMNMSVQLVLGIPLECVHGWWRILLIYSCGVVAGSLASSITDPHVYLAGASGGVYTLLTAHIASIIMNWSEMACPAIFLLIYLLTGGVDLGYSVYQRYYLKQITQIGYSAHIAGAITGLLVGINVLRNLKRTKCENVLWWISLVCFALCIATMIFLNIFWTKHFMDG